MEGTRIALALPAPPMQAHTEGREPSKKKSRDEASASGGKQTFNIKNEMRWQSMKWALVCLQSSNKTHAKQELLRFALAVCTAMASWLLNRPTSPFQFRCRSACSLCRSHSARWVAAAAAAATAAAASCLRLRPWNPLSRRGCFGCSFITVLERSD